MAILPASQADGVSSLAQQLFKKIDVNRDGQLTSGEFQQFLEGLMRGNGAETRTGALRRAATAAATNKVYQPMLGFDYKKLNTPTHTTAKYVFARATQDVDLAWDRPSRSAGLERIVENVRQNGYPDAKVTGDDT